MEDIEQVSLTIDAASFRFWENLEFKWSIDSYSSISFSAPLEPSSREFRDTFRPFKYQRCEVSVEDRILFVGTIVGVHPTVSPDRKTVEVTAYALPGVLEDCTAPIEILPFEYTDLKLYTIASTLVKPFGFQVYQVDNTGAPFDKIACDSDKKLHEFIADLAQHRNLVVSNTPEGDLLIWASVQPGNPVARLSGNESPVESVEASFSPQDYHSEITGFAPPKRGRAGSKWTEKNKWLTGVLRPASFKFDKIEKGDAPEATRAAMGRMFAKCVSYTVNLATWRDPHGDLWQPNTTIKLTAPDAMIYTETEFIIREVTLRQDKASGNESATIGLVLPGAFSGEIPASLPWDEA